MAQFYNITGTSKNIFQIGYNGPVFNKLSDGLKITLNNSLSPVYFSTLYFNDDKTSYINATQYTGNASSATKASQDADGKTISSTYLKLSGTTALAGNIVPSKTTTYNLGSETKTFASIYASAFVGNLAGNASTATKASQDGDGNVISSTYLKLSGTTALTGSIIPSTTNSVELGSSTKVYKNIYATKFTGDLEGNAKTSTSATTADSATSAVSAKNDSDGNEIKSTYIKLSGTTALAGNIVPSTNNTRNLGSSDKVFANVYATKFTGDLEGNAKTATTATSANSATKATQDADGNVISSTYQKVISGWQISNSSGSYVINNTNNTAAKLILPSASTSNPTWNNKKIMLESDVENMIADMTTSGMEYSGTVSTLTEFNELKSSLKESNKGNFFKVAAAFDVYEVGDSLIWNGSSFDAIQGNIKDAVTNPTTSTSGQIAVFTANNVVKGTNADEISVGSATSATKDSDGNTISTHYQPKVTALGSTTEPVYISAAGTFSKASKYAGGSLVKLNNVSKGAASAEFYAPTAGGTAGQILIGGGTTSAPTWLSAGTSGQILVSKGANSPSWTAASSITVGKATSAESATTAGTATNVAGGAAGKLVYQSAANTTAFLDNGTSGYLLKSQGSNKAPVWFEPNYKELIYTENTNPNSLVSNGQYYISSVTLGSTALSGVLDVKVDKAKTFSGTNASIFQTFYATDGSVWYRTQAINTSSSVSEISTSWTKILENGKAVGSLTSDVANTVKVSVDDTKNYYLAGFNYSSNNTNDVIYKTKRARISTDGSLYLADNNTNGATLTLNVTSGNITFSKNGNSTEYVLTLPTKTGTLATTDDVNAVSTNVSNNYLKLTGGTIGNTSFGPLVIERKSNQTGTAAGIGFKNVNGTLGYIAMQDVDGGLVRYSADNSKAYLVLDTNNVESNLDDVYLRQDGGSLTGALSSNSNITTTANVTAAKLVKSGGTASQILMADGSTLDKSTLQASGNYVTYTTSGSTRTIANAYKYTGHQTFTTNQFSIYSSGSDANDSWVRFTDDSTSVYAFGIRRPYAGYGFQIKKTIDGTTSYYKIWNEDNHGPGSGLNADLLDGKHASAFATSGHTHDNYLTEEKDTLQTVTDRGATTNKAISTAGLTTSSTLYVTGTTGHREGIRISPYSGLSSIWWNATGTQDYTTGQMWGITAYLPTFTDTSKQNTFRFRGPSSSSATSATDQMWINADGLVTSRGGFKKDGSSDSYILLAGGGTKAISSLQAAGNYVTTDTTQTISGEKTFSKDINISGQTNSSSYLNPGVAFLNGTTELVKISANSTGNLGFSYNGAAAKYIFGPEVLRPNTSFTGQINLGQSDARFKGYFTTLDLTGALSSTSTITTSSTVKSSGFIHSDIAEANRSKYLLTADGETKAIDDFQVKGNYVTTDTAQNISGKKTFLNSVAIRSGDSAGALILGADLSAATLTENSRKLGRMVVPAYNSNGSTNNTMITAISADSQPNVNYIDFGGHPKNTSTLAPDVLRFTVSKAHDNTDLSNKVLALQISNQNGLVDIANGGTSAAAAKFFIPLQTESGITNTGNIVNNGNLLTKTLELTDETAVNHILFKRAGWNYVTAPNSGGTMAFIAGKGNTTTANNASLAIRSDCLLPGLRDNEINIGGEYNSKIYHFKNLYLNGKIYNGSYNYTLPSKTGTLATTSDISDAIPTGYSDLVNWTISQNSDKNLIIQDKQSNGAYLTLPTGVNTSTTSRPSWNGSNLVTVADIEDFVKDTEALKYKGSITGSNYATIKSSMNANTVGSFYKVSTAFGLTSAGAVTTTKTSATVWYEVGDSLIWNGTSFDAIQTNIDVDSIKSSIISSSYWANVSLSSSSNKTTKPTFAQVKIEDGDASGALIIGGNSGATGLTAGNRKLARICMPGNGATGSDKNICLISGDTSSDGSSIFQTTGNHNRVEFGGRLGDGTNTSPDSIAFTVAKTHNGTGSTNKIYALEMNKEKARFNVSVEATKFVNTSVTSNANKAILLADGSTTSTDNFLTSDVLDDYAKTDGTKSMTGSLWFNKVDGPKVITRATDKVVKVWETGYNDHATQNSFDNSYSERFNPSDRTLKLYFSNGTTDTLIRTINSDGTTSWNKAMSLSSNLSVTGSISEGGSTLASKYSYVKIDISTSTSTTSGTLTSDQLTNLKSNPHRTVLNWAGYYCFAENLSGGSTWYYSANCTFGTNSVDKKVISINTSTGAWKYEPYTYSKINSKYVTTENKELPITTRYNNTTGETKYTEESKYVEGVTINPSTKTITATNFKGLADQATKDGSGNVITDTYLPLSGSSITSNSKNMTGPIMFNNVDGIKVNSHNTDRKIWEVYGNSGNYEASYGFHELYKGTGSDSDNTLDLYAHNRTTTNHVLVRSIDQAGVTTWKTTFKSAGQLQVTNTTEATSTTAAALIVSGGVGISKQLRVGGALTGSSTASFSGAITANSTTDSSSVSTGSLIVKGGAGIAKNLYVGENIYVPAAKYAYFGTSKLASFRANTSGDFIVGSYGNMHFRAGLQTNTTDGSSDGIKFTSTALQPEKDITKTLGTTTTRFSTTYSKYFNGILESPYRSARLTSMNFELDKPAEGMARMRLDLATSSVTDGSTPAAGFIQTYTFDTKTTLMAQLYIPAGTSFNEARPSIRFYNNAWETSWRDLALYSDIPTSIKNIKIETSASTEVSVASIYHSTSVENSKYYNILRSNYSSSGYYNELAIPVTGDGLKYRKTQNNTTDTKWTNVIDDSNVNKYAITSVVIEGPDGSTSTGSKDSVNGTYTVDISGMIPTVDNLASNFVTVNTKQNIRTEKSFGAGVKLGTNTSNTNYDGTTEGCQMKYNSTKKCVQFIFSD